MPCVAVNVAPPVLREQGSETKGWAGKQSGPTAKVSKCHQRVRSHESVEDAAIGEEYGRGERWGCKHHHREADRSDVDGPSWSHGRPPFSSRPSVTCTSWAIASRAAWISHPGPHEPHASASPGIGRSTQSADLEAAGPNTPGSASLPELPGSLHAV
jgi:hypothetical protein